MKYYAINDQQFLEEIRSGALSGLDVVCPKFPEMKLDRSKLAMNGLLSKNDAQNFAEAVLVRKAATWLDFTMNKQEEGVLSIMLKPLMQCSKLEQLYLQVAGANEDKVIVSDDDIDVLAELISQSTSLTKLDLSSLKLSPSQQIKIIRACVQSPSLEKISFPYDVFSEDGIPKEAVEALGELFSKSKTLKSIDLPKFSLGSSELRQLLNCLAQNEDNVLEEFALCMNPVGAAGLAALADFSQLPQCKLQKMDIGSTVVDGDPREDCIEALYKLINGNERLRELSCTHMSLDENALTKIVEALRNNHVLYKIDLAGNEFLGVQRLRALPAMARATGGNVSHLIAELEEKIKTNAKSEVENPLGLDIKMNAK